LIHVIMIFIKKWGEPLNKETTNTNILIIQNIFSF